MTSPSVAPFAAASPPEDGDVPGNWVASPCGASPGAANCTWAPPPAPQTAGIVITEVKGTDQNADSKVESRILWQRFDGQYVVTPEVGCNQTTSLATLPDNRTMALDELLFHVQVTYRYQPIFSSVPFQMLSLPVDFSRHAMFRARSTQFQTPTPDTDFPPKTKCASVTGL